MEILASATQHQHRHWYRHCKKIIFAIIISFFLKKSRIFMFFLVLSYGISTTLLQILSSLRFRIYPVKGVHWCSRKKLFEHLEASILVFFKKKRHRKFLHSLHTFQQNIQDCLLIKYAYRPSWDYSKKFFIHLSYMQFIDYLQIHGITYITYLNI